MTIRISFSEKAVRVAVEINGAIESAITHLPERPWVGLTDDEIWNTVSRIGTSDSDVNPLTALKNARAIEALLRSKNT